MKDIPGFEGLYAVTKDGRVWSHPKKVGDKGSHNGKWMRPYKMNGYWAIVLRDASGKKCRLLVHRLVALTYLPLPALQVNHKNSNRQDNRIENLEWCTGKENLYHALPKIVIGAARGERNPASKLTDDIVREIRRLRAEEGLTYQAIAKRFSIDNARVSRIVNRQVWAHVQ